MTGLKKELGLFEVTLYGIGIILGAGIYSLIGEAAGLAGNALWLSFVIAAIIATFTGLSYAELATMYPKAAAEYEYVKKGFSNNLLAFLVGWVHLFTGMTTAATVSLGFASYFTGLFGTSQGLVAVVLILFLSLINFIGIKQSTRMNVLFTLLEVSGLLFIIFLAFSNIDNVRTVNFLLFKDGVQGVFASTALVFFAYLGFEDIANVAEETKNPRQILSTAFILAIVITTILYVLTAIAAVSLVRPDELSASESPLAYAASKTFLGSNAFILLSVIALFATANTVLIALVVGSRMVYGMARDKSFPRILSKIHKKTGTPYIAVLLVMIIPLLFIFIGKMSFIANITSLGAFLTFAFINGALVLLRFKEPYRKRPFKSPINIGRFPVLAALGLLTSLFMMYHFSFNVLIITLGVISLGLVFYIFFTKIYDNKKNAK